MRLEVHEKSTARETGKIEQDKPDNTWNPSPVEIDDFVEQLECGVSEEFCGKCLSNYCKGNIC